MLIQDHLCSHFFRGWRQKKADLHRVIKGRALVVVAYMFLEQACLEFILRLTRGMASTGDGARRKGGGEIHLREK